MHLELTDAQSAALRDFLERQLGDLSMEISHTDNPGFRKTLVERRDLLRGVHAALAAPPQAS